MFIVEMQGFAEGMEKGMEKLVSAAKKFKDLGVDMSIIEQATGLTQEEINSL